MFDQALPFLDLKVSDDKEELGFVFAGVEEDALLAESEGDAKWRRVGDLYACLGSKMIQRGRTLQNTLGLK